MSSVLKAVLHEHRLTGYREFVAAYDRYAAKVDPASVGRSPTKTQFYRWSSGDMQRIPRGHHCRVLEAMFPDWTAEQLFAEDTYAETRVDSSNVVAVRSSRIAFPGAWPLEYLLLGAQDVAVAGVSLNVLCQQTPDRQLIELLESGTRIHALFLDPGGTNMAIREREIGYVPDTLKMMTTVNIQALQRLRSAVPPDAASRLEIRTYDEPPRFHLIIVNSSRCVIAPYLPDRRGVDSPSFAISDLPEHEDLRHMFCDVFEGLWSRSRSQELGAAEVDATVNPSHANASEPMTGRSADDRGSSRVVLLGDRVTDSETAGSQRRRGT